MNNFNSFHLATLFHIYIKDSQYDSTEVTKIQTEQWGSWVTSSWWILLSNKYLKVLNFLSFSPIVSGFHEESDVFNCVHWSHNHRWSLSIEYLLLFIFCWFDLIISFYTCSFLTQESPSLSNLRMLIFLILISYPLELDLV